MHAPTLPRHSSLTLLAIPASVIAILWIGRHITTPGLPHPAILLSLDFIAILLLTLAAYYFLTYPADDHPDTHSRSLPTSSPPPPPPPFPPPAGLPAPLPPKPTSPRRAARLPILQPA